MPYVAGVIPPAAEEFLHGHTRTFLVTVRPDGAPTCHPMVGMYHGGALYMTTYRKSAKVRNLAREPRVACVVVTADDAPRFGGVVLRGRAELLPPGATMPWSTRGAAPTARVPGADADLGRAVAAKLAEGKRVVVRVVPEEVRLVGEHA